MSVTELNKQTADQSDGVSANTRLAVLETRVNSLFDRHRRWYKEPSTLIAFLALLGSLFGFLNAQVNDIEKERVERRSELQATMLMLHTVTNQWAESYLKYKNDPEYQTLLNPAMKSEISLLGSKAYYLLSLLEDRDSSLDYATVANALEQTADYRDAVKTLMQGLERAKNPGEYIILARALGKLAFYRGENNQGNEYFEKAKTAFDHFPAAGVNQAEIDNYTAETEAYWAIAAASQKACDLAKLHVDKVRQYMATGPGSAETVKNSLAPLVNQALSACPV